MIKNFVAAFMLLWAAVSTPAFAQEKGAVRPGFSAESLKGEKILLLRPSVWVGSQSAGGTATPNADWTAQARDFMTSELELRKPGFTTQIVVEPDLVGADAALVSGYKVLFAAVSSSVVNYQFFAGNRLPTRKNKAFDWTLGSGTKRLADLTGAKYGLFIYTRDEYGSTGRKLLQFFAAGLAGISVKSGNHFGHAGLVDLTTGELVWLNADFQMGGDVRTADGMNKRVGQLLEDFPGITAPRVQ